MIYSNAVRDCSSRCSVIAVATLDHPGDVSPDYHTDVESQLPWLTIDDDLPHYQGEDLWDEYPACYGPATKGPSAGR